MTKNDSFLLFWVNFPYITPFLKLAFQIINVFRLFLVVFLTFSFEKTRFLAKNIDSGLILSYFGHILEDTNIKWLTR